MSMIYAHRGASAYAPENTLEAFALAIEMGADGIELDVHLSKDGELMVIHDETVDRTTNGHGQVKDFTCGQLQKLDASNGMEGFPHARIPTLAEVYDLLKGTRLWVNVELKTDANFYPGIEEKCIALAKEKGMEERIVYSSFNHYSIANVLKLAPSAKTGLLYMSGLYEPWHYAKQVGAKYIHPFFANLRLPELVQGCKENGIGINPWTIDDPNVMQMCLAADIGIITNKPDVAVALREK